MDDDTASRTVLPFPAVPARQPAAPVSAAASGEPARSTAPPEPLWRELVGQVLRSERIETGRTLQQVAERAGVSPQYLSEVERGRKDASSEMLESICGAIGLRLADLLAVSSRILGCSMPVGAQGAGGYPPTATRPAGPTGVVLLAA